jgi:diguanylate cyclase (GGDEF)-like protein
VVTAELRKEVSDLSPLAFSSDQGLTRKQVQAQLDVGERQIGLDAARLGRLAGDSQDAAMIMSPARRMFTILDRVNTLASSGRVTAASVLMGNAGRPSAPESQLARVFNRLSHEYDSEAARARMLAEAGSLFAFVSVLLAFSLAFYRASALAREKHQEALTDPLTGLANRRKLFADMDELLRREREQGETLALGMFDLDGFKIYNDTFGHPAGDALLSRLGHKLRATIGANATAYRMGGDEFCVIARGTDVETTLAKAQSALSEQSEGFAVTCSVGSVVIVANETTLEQALGQADQRLYNNKRSSRTREGGEAHDVLLQVLAENSASLATHLSNVGRLAEAVARRLGLSDAEVTLTRLTAELHDIGKTAIPDTILDKPGALDAGEWEFMRRHTLISERILAAAPALAQVAPLVRATHERADGAGYPDGLHAHEIPLSSRIVAVVDAYDAMTSKRPYSLPLTPNEAIAELRRCTGSQFDPIVAKAFIAVWQESAEDTTTNHRTDPSSIAA